MIIKHIDIWKGYDFNGETRPRMTTYIRHDKPRGMVLILPGGGYEHVSEREGEGVALQFVSAGYNAAILEYSVSPFRFPQALQDAFRALTLILEQSQTWKIKTHDIFLCGFSAGGHLAACISNLYKTPTFSHYEGVNIKNLNIKGCILSYPVITAGQYAHKASFENLFGGVSQEVSKLLSMELSVNKNTPKTFLWHTFDDMTVPVQNSLLYAKALAEHQVAFEMHIYPEGVHGLSLATTETASRPEHINHHVSSWMPQCLKWMKTL